MDIYIGLNMLWFNGLTCFYHSQRMYQEPKFSQQSPQIMLAPCLLPGWMKGAHPSSTGLSTLWWYNPRNVGVKQKHNVNRHFIGYPIYISDGHEIAHLFKYRWYLLLYLLKGTLTYIRSIMFYHVARHVTTCKATTNHKY